MRTRNATWWLSQYGSWIVGGITYDPERGLLSTVEELTGRSRTVVVVARPDDGAHCRVDKCRSFDWIDAGRWLSPMNVVTIGSDEFVGDTNHEERSAQVDSGPWSRAAIIEEQGTTG